jgi:hypothetical protein
MHTRLRLLALVGVSAVALAAASSAFAFHCTVVRKPTGSGSAGSIVVQVNSDGTVTPLSAELFVAPNGNPEGGFFTVTWVDPSGDTISVNDVFSHGVRPDGALMSGPGGTSECDGVGIDDVFNCLGIEE